MKKLLLIIAPLIFAGLMSCSPPKHLEDVMVDDTGYIHHTVSYLDDKRGKEEFPKTRETHGKKLFIFDPKAYAWAAYNEAGIRVKTGRASGGRIYCKDLNESCKTVTGRFHVYHKKDHNCRSDEFPKAKDGHVVGGAKMPYCMHFYKGYAIHGAYEVPHYNSSYGCIRVLPGAAQWLNEQFIDIGTTVLVMPYTPTTP